MSAPGLSSIGSQDFDGRQGRNKLYVILDDVPLEKIPSTSLNLSSQSSRNWLLLIPTCIRTVKLRPLVTTAFGGKQISFGSKSLDKKQGMLTEYNFHSESICQQAWKCLV